MKTFFMSLIMVALTAKAGNEGPQAAPQEPKTQVIAQVVQSGGFRPVTSPMLISVDILSSGEVKEVQTYQDGKVKARALAKLSPAVLAKVKKLVSEVKEGELTDLNPEAPACMDAPGTTYIAIQNGKEVKISGKYNCKEYQKANAESADYALENILSGLRSLAAAL